MNKCCDFRHNKGNISDTFEELKHMHTQNSSAFFLSTVLHLLLISARNICIYMDIMFDIIYKSAYLHIPVIKETYNSET